MGREQNFFRVGKEVRYTLENVFSVKNGLKNIRHDKNSYSFHEFRQFLTKIQISGPLIFRLTHGSRVRTSKTATATASQGKRALNFNFCTYDAE